VSCVIPQRVLISKVRIPVLHSGTVVWNGESTESKLSLPEIPCCTSQVAVPTPCSPSEGTQWHLTEDFTSLDPAQIFTTTSLYKTAHCYYTPIDYSCFCI